MCPGADGWAPAALLLSSEGASPTLLSCFFQSTSIYDDYAVPMRAGPNQALITKCVQQSTNPVWGTAGQCGREFTSVPCADVNHDDEASLRADGGNGAHAPQRQCTGRMCRRCHALDYACKCPVPTIAGAP
jgi:hypothetical protein